jgi:hypothetical protein
MRPCVYCHDAHDPRPPQIPGACSACHPAIARTMAISKHATLECETCHEAAPEHRTDPLSNLPGKPNSREFCGQCHSGDGSGTIPQVDLAAHGERYLCWQCHYPHKPEAR